MFIDRQKLQNGVQRDQNTRSSSGASEQLSFEQEKKRKFYIKQAIYLLYYLARIALTIAILVTLHQNFIASITSTPEFARMQQNIALWKQDVIVNITTVNSYNCPEGYETYTAYEWPGTKEGCYCYTSLGEWDYMKILQGSCSDMAMGAGCRTVKKTSAIPFLFWKKDELICLKRVKNLDFFSSLSDIGVPAIQCSPGKDYQLRIPSNLTLSSCPITDLSSTLTLPFQLPQINFSFTRASSYPIVSLRMTEYEFCPDFSKQNISPFKQRANNYNLENKNREYCEGVDSRVVVVDQIGEDQLFGNNPRITDVIEGLPAYPEPMADYRYKLGFVRYPEWKYSCRVSQPFNLHTAQTHLTLQSTLNFTHTCQSLGTAFITLAGGILTLFFIYRKVHQLYYRIQQKVLYDTLPELQKKKPNLYERFHKRFITELVIFVASVLLALGLIIDLAVMHQQLQNNFLWYKDARGCTSETMRELIDVGYVRFFDMEQKNALLGIVLVLSLGMVDTGMFLWRNFKGDLRKLRQEEQEEMTNIFDDDFNKNHEHQHEQKQQRDLFQMDVRDKEIVLERFNDLNDYNNNTNNPNTYNNPPSQQTNPPNQLINQPIPIPTQGQIVRNRPPSQQLNITEESLISQSMDYAHPTQIVRPKRQKRSKIAERSEVSDVTDQWDV